MAINLFFSYPMQYYLVIFFLFFSILCLQQIKETTPLLDPKSVAHQDKEGFEAKRTIGVATKDSLV